MTERTDRALDDLEATVRSMLQGLDQVVVELRAGPELIPRASVLQAIAHCRKLVSSTLPLVKSFKTAAAQARAADLHSRHMAAELQRLGDPNERAN